MKITNEEVVSHLHGQKAEENDKILSSLTQETQELNNQLEKIFNSRLVEIKPVIDVIRKKRYYFKHPDEECKGMTSRGPIIDYDNNYYYVYSIEEGKVYKVNNYNPENPEKINFFNFIKSWDFDKAMKGLNFVLELQEHYADVHKKNHAEMRMLIEKYV